jgi:hypothetical protein
MRSRIRRGSFSNGDVVEGVIMIACFLKAGNKEDGEDVEMK